MSFRWVVVMLVLAAGLPTPAPAQTSAQAPTGLQLARAFIDRMVRVTGKQTQGMPGEAGYGVIAGERRETDGSTTLIIVVPDRLVRDPTRADARFGAPSVVFRADPIHPVPGQLLDQRLAAADGNLAVLAVPRPAALRLRPAASANTDQLDPGAPAWQVGRTTDWAPLPAPGRFALRDRAGWLTFESLDNTAIGSAVVTERGFVGMLVGPNQTDPQLSQVLPVELIASKLRQWGLPWDLAAADGTARPPAEPAAPAPAAAAPPTASPDLVLLLPAEVAARRSWTPEGAKVSPWMDTPVRLRGAPRRDSPQIGTLPPGRLLPPFVLVSGAYEVVYKLDGGAWFLLGISGQPIGYAAGSDVVEIWPSQATAGLTGGKVIREWTPAAGQVARLRDAGNTYELETAVTCKAAFCESIIVFTPAPPAPGAIVPTFQLPPRSGQWRQGDVVALRMQVPRRIVDTAGTRLAACIGHDSDCDEQALLPPPSGN